MSPCTSKQVTVDRPIINVGMNHDSELEPRANSRSSPVAGSPSTRRPMPSTRSWIAQSTCQSILSTLTGGTYLTLT